MSTTVLDKTYLTSKWWILTTQGILAILFGIAFVFWPGISLVSLVWLFGAYVVAAGVLSLVDALLAVGKSKGGTWVLELLLGAAQLGIGVFLLRNPTVTFATLIILIAAAFIAFAVFEIITSIADRDATATGRMLSIIAGVMAAVVGVFVLSQPVASGVAFVWILGLFNLIHGPILIALSLDVKSLNDALEGDKKKK